MRIKSDYKPALLLVALGVLVAGLVLIFPTKDNISDIEDDERGLSEHVHNAYSKNENLYAVNSTVNLKQKYSEKIYGGIVSHHLLANIDIARFFFEFSDQKVDRVILVGPNHFYPNSFPVLTTSYDYMTPFGSVRLDNDYIERLKSESIVKINQNIIDTEHSISSLVPYIAHYLPDAELVPIIISHNASEELINRLSEFLKKNNSENTVVIASVDFSHHLYSNAATLHDMRSVAAIKSFDIESLSELEIDSPQSISVLLQYLDAIEAYDISVRQQNSALIFDEYDMDDVTSYVFAYARKGIKDKTPGTSILFFGDTMLGRGVKESIESGVDLFAGIRGPEGNFLKGYDAVSVNLEGAILSEDCSVLKDELVIDSDNLNILIRENISHVGIKNNHFQRCDTEVSSSIIQESGLKTLDNVAIIEGTENSIAVMSLYAAPVPKDIGHMVSEVENQSERYENLVVNIHWGVEYSVEPTTAQRMFARAMIDAGADIIIGHHPHVIQPVEKYNNGIIVYSLGNFISDQEGDLTKSGLAAGIFFGEKNKSLFLFPFRQINGVPTHLSQEDAGDVCKEIIYRSVDSSVHNCVINVPE